MLYDDDEVDDKLYVLIKYDKKVISILLIFELDDVQITTDE